MTNFSDNNLGNDDSSAPRDANPADKPNLASMKVSHFYDSYCLSWTGSVRRDVMETHLSFKSSFDQHRWIGPVDEEKAYFHEFEKLLEKMNNRNNFSSTEHWMHEVDRFTSAMCVEITKTREEILQNNALINANQLLLAEVLVESAEACDPIEPLALTFGSTKKCLEFLCTIVSQSKVEFDKSMSGQSRDPSKAAGVYRFIEPKTSLLNAQQGQLIRNENRLRQEVSNERSDREYVAEKQALEKWDQEFSYRKYAPQGVWADPNIALNLQDTINRKLNFMNRMAGEVDASTMNLSDISARKEATDSLLGLVHDRIRKNHPDDTSRVGVNKSIFSGRLRELYDYEVKRLHPIFNFNYDYASQRRFVLAPPPLNGIAYRATLGYRDWHPTEEQLDEIIKFSPEPERYEPQTDYYPPRAKDFEPAKGFVPIPAKIRKKKA